MDGDRSSVDAGDAPIAKETVEQNAENNTPEPIRNAKTPVASKADSVVHCVESSKDPSIPFASRSISKLRIDHSELSNIVASKWLEKSQNTETKSELPSAEPITKNAAVASNPEAVETSAVPDVFQAEKDSANQNSSDRDAEEVSSQTSLGTQEEPLMSNGAAIGDSQPPSNKLETAKTMLALLGSNSSVKIPSLPEKADKEEPVPAERSPDISPKGNSPIGNPSTIEPADTTMNPNELNETNKDLPFSGDTSGPKSPEKVVKDCKLEEASDPKPSPQPPKRQSTAKRKKTAMSPEEMAKEYNTLNALTEGTSGPKNPSTPEKIVKDGTLEEASDPKPSPQPLKRQPTARRKKTVMSPGEMATEYNALATLTEGTSGPKNPSTPEKVVDTSKESSTELATPPPKRQYRKRRKDTAMSPNDLAKQYSELAGLTGTNVNSHPNRSPAKVPRSFMHDKMEPANGSKQVEVNVRFVVDNKEIEEGEVSAPEVGRRTRGKKKPSVHKEENIQKADEGEIVQKALTRQGSKRNKKKSTSPKKGKAVGHQKAQSHGKVWTKEEHQALLQGVAKFGTQWAEVAKIVPSRSVDQIKSRWWKHRAMTKKEEAKVEKKEAAVQESAAVDQVSSAHRPRRSKAKPKNYSEAAMVVDNRKVDDEDADELLEQNLGTKRRGSSGAKQKSDQKGTEAKATKKNAAKRLDSLAKTKSEKGLNKLHRGRTRHSTGSIKVQANSIGKSVLEVSGATTFSGNESASTDVNSNDRKRKQAVISDSDGEMQKGTESHEPASFPEALEELFVIDFMKEDKTLGRKHSKEMAPRIWNQTPKELKRTLPKAKSKNSEQQLRDWKLQHFGLDVKIPLAHIDGCPDCLLPLLREDFDGDLKRGEIRRMLIHRWKAVSESAKDSLPKEGDANYFSELKKWKLQHIPNAADGATVKKPSGRKRSRPRKYDDETQVSATQEDNKDSLRPSQPIRKRPKGVDAAETMNEDGSQLQQQGLQVSISPSKYVQKKDPNEFYIEEEAHLYHNPPLPSIHTEGVQPKDLKPIPSPPPLPESFPDTGKCKWSWEDKLHRVLLADFSGSFSSSNTFVMDSEDEIFFLQMMERNDITLKSEGLISVQTLNPNYWTPEYLRRVLGSEYFHKFRRFDTTRTKSGHEKCVEVDGMISMKVGDYIRYLEMRQDFLHGNDGAEDTFSFVNHEGKTEKVNVGKSALYMIDVDTNRLLPKLNENFLESFRYHGVLPGGSHCLMNSVTNTARPFMGPNMYVTPPATFTHFHQDGHGTVDSGHLCISGFNEVVMLRRLTERHKQHALMILTGDFGDEKKSKGKASLPTYFDGLYSEPHGDLLGEKPSWPSRAQIEKCREMGYCPTVCMVKPGQLIHINKGRLHAFRKMSTAALPEGDCHKTLREQTIAEHKLSNETLCVSMAWDWMYRGVSAEGINREVSAVLEAVVLNRKHGRVSLAIPEFSLFQMAKVLNPATVAAPKLRSFIGIGGADSIPFKEQQIPDSKTISRGILPSLRHTVQQQLNTMSVAASAASKSVARGKRVTIAKRPNTHEDPLKFPLDPYGNDGFACKLCSRELSNIYYHCDGCEILLSKDFNICRECYRDKIFMKMVQMHPTNPKKHASLNHTGNMHLDRVSRCPCKNGPVCGHCGYCLGCSCRCHTWFTLHSRVFGEKDANTLLTGVEKAAGCIPCETQKSKKYGELLAERLEAAAKVH